MFFCLVYLMYKRVLFTDVVIWHNCLLVQVESAMLCDLIDQADEHALLNINL